MERWFVPLHDNNCKFIIDLMDYFEDSRLLSGNEVALRDDARAALGISVRQQAALWR